MYRLIGQDRVFEKADKRLIFDRARILLEYHKISLRKPIFARFNGDRLEYYIKRDNARFILFSIEGD